MVQPGHLSVEITDSCNELCRHCYHPEKRKPAFLSDIVLLDKLFAEFGELGFMFLTITGGEPLLHPKFEEICKIAQKNRYAISLKTNGTLINAESVKFFQGLKPLNIEISLYSADDFEHDSVTRSQGSFSKSLDGIRKLKNGGVHVSVITPVINGIKNWTGLYSLMKESGVPWSCSPHIHSSFDERREIGQFKGTVQSHIEFLEFVNSHENQKIQNIDELCFTECGGGDAVACIGPDFSIRACISFPLKAGFYKEGKAAELLQTARAQLKKRFALLECHDCELVKYCKPCPAKIKVTDCGSECDISRKNYAEALKQIYGDFSSDRIKT